jgi:hypothetical protein
MNELFKGIQNGYPISCPFGVKRDWGVYKGSGVNGEDGVHEGTDRVSSKGTPIKAEIDGTVDGVFNNKANFGLFVKLKTDLGFIDKSLLGEILYSIYGHLHTTFISRAGSFIDAGTIIGQMGNSGKCLTPVDPDNPEGEWRDLTPEEVSDVECQKGVHLHTSFFTWSEPIIHRIREVLKLTDDTWFAYQWRKYWISPEIFFQFLEEYK